MAAEQAKSEGYKVEVYFVWSYSFHVEPSNAQLDNNWSLTLQTVIVGDDCALPPPRGIAGRRGLAGTILVLKVLSLSHTQQRKFSGCHVNPTQPNPPTPPKTKRKKYVKKKKEREEKVRERMLVVWSLFHLL